MGKLHAEALCCTHMDRTMLDHHALYPTSLVLPTMVPPQVVNPVVISVAPGDDASHQVNGADQKLAQQVSANGDTGIAADQEVKVRVAQAVWANGKVNSGGMFAMQVHS